MTIEHLLRLALSLNPGFILMGAALGAASAPTTALRRLATLGGPALALGALVFPPAAGAEVARAVLFNFHLALYRPDSLSMIFGLSSVLAAGLGGPFALNAGREPGDRLDDVGGLLCAGGALGAVSVGDLISLAAFFELMMLGVAALVMAEADRQQTRADLRCLVLPAVSSLLLTAGVTIYGVNAGSFLFVDLGPLREGALAGLLDVDEPGGPLILAALAIQTGFPFVHSWLIDTASGVSARGGVLLSAHTTTAAIYVIARCFAGSGLLVWAGAAMSVYPVFVASSGNDLRRVLAYSTISQTGFMVCALGVGVPLALNAAAALAFAHIIIKTLLLMVMGAVSTQTGSPKATELGGIHRTMPFTTLFGLIGAASIVAVPFTAGFAAQSMLFAAVENLAAGGVWAILAFALVGGIQNVGLRLPSAVFFGRDGGGRPREAPFPMLLAMGAAAGLCLVIGFWPQNFYRLLPYRDQALAFLTLDLGAPRRALVQGQLLAGAAVAFLLLHRIRRDSPVRAGPAPDGDGMGLKALLSVWLAVLRKSRVARDDAEAWFRTSCAPLFADAAKVFTPERPPNPGLLLAQCAVWTGALLVLVLIAAMSSPA